jgi:tetratricopeptide (TPR) repeat protein
MEHTTSPSAEHRKGSRPSVLAPVAVLCLFAGTLPTQIAGRSAGPSSEHCLMLADSVALMTPERQAQLEQCSALYPDDVELLAELGSSYESIDREKAERTYQRVLQLDPDYADVRLRLGRLLLAGGSAGEALKQADAALRVQPNRLALLELRDRARRANDEGEQ